jgi:imidazolonepropionase-like amidohydrolase
MSPTTGTHGPTIERNEMNASFTHELTPYYQAGLLREAQRARLARTARYGGEVAFGGPIKPVNSRTRLVFALGVAATGILVTASAVLAAVR